MVPIEPPRAWMRPGSRGLVEYAGDAYSHERLFTYPYSSRTWLVESGDGDVYLESINQYTRLRKRTGEAPTDLPDDVRHAVVFAEKLSREEILQRIVSGGNAVLAERARNGKVYDDSGLQGVDWDGADLAIPSEGPVAAVRRRFGRKQAPLPIDTHLAEQIPSPKKAEPQYESAGANFVWLQADPCACNLSGAILGSEVKVPRGSTIEGDCAIVTTAAGAFLARRVRADEAPYFVDSLRKAFPDADAGDGGVLTPSCR